MQRLPNPPWDISSIVDGTSAIKQLIYRQYRLGCVFGRSMHLTSAGSTVSAAKLITIFVVDLYSISYLVHRLNLIKRSRWSQGKTNCSFYFEYLYIYPQMIDFHRRYDRMYYFGKLIENLTWSTICNGYKVSLVWY